MNKVNENGESIDEKVVWLVNGKGNFVEVYDNDAKILNYLLSYKIMNGNKAAFPRNALPKVMSVLENNKVSYKYVVNKKNEFKDFYNLKGLSRYDSVLKKAEENYTAIEKIDKVVALLSKCDEKKMDDLLEVLENWLMKNLKS